MSSGKKIEISIEQLRAARALLNISQRDLAERAGVGIQTIKRLETPVNGPTSEEMRDHIVQVLEKAGVEFTDGSKPGVRMK
jgi:transcriptional regulator with XRE-family HTH domain